MDARCDKHVGEPFAVRCPECDLAEVEAAAEIVHRRLDQDRTYPQYKDRGISANSPRSNFQSSISP